MEKCDCGHAVNKHDFCGCHHTSIISGYDAVCSCNKTPQKMVAALQSRIAQLEDERRRISDAIKIKTESGEVPDNLADHVELLMLQEYYPMLEKLNRLTNG